MPIEAVSSPWMDLQRFGFKFFVEQPDAVRLTELIPVFHRWIQTHAVGGLLIDVADYSHVHHGPGIMLIAHEGHYAVDMRDGRMGLAYWCKQPLPDTLPERMARVCGVVLDACRQLEEAPELEGKIRFRGEELLFLANDRLHAPNTPATHALLRPPLSEFSSRLYAGIDCSLRPEPDPREPFMLGVTASQPVGIEVLRQRLAPR